MNGGVDGILPLTNGNASVNKQCYFAKVLASAHPITFHGTSKFPDQKWKEQEDYDLWGGIKRLNDVVR